MKAISLTEKDRRTLAVLGLFLALAGYYQFVFDPVYTKWKAADKVLGAKSKELKRMEKTLREFRVIKRERDELAARVSLVSARVKMPPLGESQHEVLKAIMTAASHSSVQIINIRPVAAQEADGRTGGPKAFAVEGNATTDQFVRLMERVWGMKIEELNLSLTDDQQRPVHFYTMLTLLPSARLDYPKAEVRVASFKLKQDPFLPGQQPATGLSKAMGVPLAVMFPVPGLPPPPGAPPSEPQFSVAGLRLIGITSVNGKPGAIVLDDSQGGRELYLEVGDRFKDSVVAAIDGKGFTLRVPGSPDARVEFPPRQGFEVPEQEHAPQSPPPTRNVSSAKSGRLGLQVMNLSAELARQKELTAKEGLLVTRARADAQEVRVNDLITSINGIKTPSLAEAQKIMRTIRAGDDLELGIFSRGAAKKVTIKALE